MFLISKIPLSFERSRDIWVHNRTYRLRSAHTQKQKRLTHLFRFSVGHGTRYYYWTGSKWLLRRFAGQARDRVSDHHYWRTPDTSVVFDIIHWSWRQWTRRSFGVCRQPVRHLQQGTWQLQGRWVARQRLAKKNFVEYGSRRRTLSCRWGVAFVLVVVFLCHFNGWVKAGTHARVWRKSIIDL